MQHEFSLLIGTAADIASRLHKGDIDRDGLPHVFHCMRVAMKQNTPNATIIGLLHDLIEDAATPEQAREVTSVIEFTFGDHVKDSCLLLTEIPSETYEDYIKRIIASGNFDAMEVKKADIEDNTKVGRVDMKAAQKFPMYKLAHMALCEALGLQSNLSLSSQE